MSQQERRFVRLVWRGPGGDNYERLLSQGETRIGRANDNDICLFSDTKASRHHAIIVVQGKAVYVRDLTSLNGTFLNDTRLSIDPMALRDRDMLVDTGFGLVSLLDSMRESWSLSWTRRVLRLPPSSSKSTAPFLEKRLLTFYAG